MNLYLIRHKKTGQFWTPARWGKVDNAFIYSKKSDEFPTVVIDGTGEYVQFCECPL